MFSKWDNKIWRKHINYSIVTFDEYQIFFLRGDPYIFINILHSRITISCRKTFLKRRDWTGSSPFFRIIKDNFNFPYASCGWKVLCWELRITRTLLQVSCPEIVLRYCAIEINEVIMRWIYRSIQGNIKFLQKCWNLSGKGQLIATEEIIIRKYFLLNELFVSLIKPD
jgi:hypothetical protein